MAIGVNAMIEVSLNTLAWLRRSSKFRREVPGFSVSAPLRISLIVTTTTRSMSRIGIGCRRTALTRVKTVVLAPMPSASETIATRATPGLRSSRRNAKRTSWSRLATRASSGAMRAPRPEIDGLWD